MVKNTDTPFCTLRLILLSVLILCASPSYPWAEQAGASSPNTDELAAAEKYMLGKYPELSDLHSSAPWLRPALENYRESFNNNLDDVLDALDAGAPIYEQILRAAASGDFEQVDVMSEALHKKYEPLTIFLLKHSVELGHYMVSDMRAFLAEKYMPATYAASRDLAGQLSSANTRSLDGVLSLLRRLWENFQIVYEARYLYAANPSNFEKVFVAQCAERYRIARMVLKGRDEYLSPCPSFTTLTTSVEGVVKRLQSSREKIKEDELLISELRDSLRSTQEQVVATRKTAATIKEAMRAKLARTEARAEKEARPARILRKIESYLHPGDAKLLTEGAGALRIRLTSVRFMSGSYGLSQNSKEVISRVARAITSISCSDCSVLVEGHTDSHGDPRQNKVLSLKRAEVVRDFLLKRGIAARAIGYGDAYPVASNKYAKGRAMNRRIELVLALKND